MNIAYSSAQDLKALKQKKDTIVITLSDTTDEAYEHVGTGWFKHYVYPFIVTNMTVSFSECDEQAMKLAEYLKTVLKEDKNIIVQCQYGEIRSRAVAQGLASALNDRRCCQIENGSWVTKAVPAGHHSAFMVRTSGFIRRAFINHKWS